MIVVGSLRAGGAGKTAFVLELCRQLSKRNYRVGIVVYQLSSTGQHQEVLPQSAWQASSDEATLLARTTDCRVFVTRDRDKTWDHLDAMNQFDLLISDDGLSDTRLHGALKLVLKRPTENPKIWDLLPAGPFRLTAKNLALADHVIEGPLAISQSPTSQLWFRRVLVFPVGFDFTKTWIVLCGMGNPAAFEQDLLSAKVKIAGMACGVDHGVPDRKQWEQLAAQFPNAGVLCSSKDGIKLQDWSFGKQSLSIIEENIDFSPEILCILEDYFRAATS